MHIKCLPILQFATLEKSSFRLATETHRKRVFTVAVNDSVRGNSPIPMNREKTCALFFHIILCTANNNNQQTNTRTASLRLFGIWTFVFVIFSTHLLTTTVTRNFLCTHDSDETIVRSVLLHFGSHAQYESGSFHLSLAANKYLKENISQDSIFFTHKIRILRKRRNREKMECILTNRVLTLLLLTLSQWSCIMQTLPWTSLCCTVQLKVLT